MGVMALLRRHPRHQEVGFSMGFSHRGNFLDGELDGLAEDFIRGVQVPER
jgi:hypothetical protein